MAGNQPRRTPQVGTFWLVAAGGFQQFHITLSGGKNKNDPWIGGIYPGICQSIRSRKDGHFFHLCIFFFLIIRKLYEFFINFFFLEKRSKKRFRQIEMVRIRTQTSLFCNSCRPVFRSCPPQWGNDIVTDIENHSIPFRSHFILLDQSEKLSFRRWRWFHLPRGFQR